MFVLAFLLPCIYCLLSLYEAFSVMLNWFSAREYLNISNKMLVLQSQGSTPKVHKRDGWLRWLHVLPYKWVRLMPQRAGSIWEKNVLWNERSYTLLLLKIISQAIWSEQMRLFTNSFDLLSVCINIFHWNYVGHLTASGGTH
jgi:hypothetical protein